METLRAIVLGVVQGLTEFLPISSSGHLILVPALFDWPDQGLAFDVALHLGTLVALLIYFWRDWVVMIRCGVRDAVAYRFNFDAYERPSLLLWAIAIGTIPAAIAGLLLENWIEDNVRQAWVVAIGLAIGGTIMLAADYYGARRKTIGDVGFKDSFLIGIAQAIALIPGISRSGSTITAGLFLGYRRDDAARFAFLLGTPAFIGAAILTAGDIGNEWRTDFGPMLGGFLASAITGVFVIHYLLRYLRTRSLLPFVIYRYAVAILTIVIAAYRVA